jgi:hypothetical protein
MTTYQVALNGLTNNSLSNDHVFAVIGTQGQFIPDLTHEQAETLAASLNG